MKKLYIRVLFRLGLLKYLNLKIKVNGFKIPVLGGVGLGNIYASDAWMSTVVKLLLRCFNGDFIDIGSNIGQTLMKVKAIDKNVAYLGFEPNPVCASYCEKLIQLNNFIETKIVPAGISNVSEIVTLKYGLDDDADSGASMVDEFRSDVTREKNIVVMNGAVLHFKSKVSVVKIDVEGAELMVIEGILKLIKRDRPAIVIEILPVYFIEQTARLQRQNRLLEIMRDLNYSFYRIRKNGDDTFNHLELISDIGIHADITQCDYVFMPIERTTEIIT